MNSVQESNRNEAGMTQEKELQKTLISELPKYGYVISSYKFHHQKTEPTLCHTACFILLGIVNFGGRYLRVYYIYVNRCQCGCTLFLL